MTTDKVIPIDYAQELIGRKRALRKKLINERMHHILSARELRLQIEALEAELAEKQHSKRSQKYNEKNSPHLIF